MSRNKTNHTPQPHFLRNMVGGSVGNILEWYDFAVFGYFAPFIGAHFFPAEDPMASLIKAYGVFAAGYLMRPLGGIIFGHIGDRLGRKRALQLSVAMMAIPTTLLGLLPTYAQVGVTASALLILLRLVQGLSVGGELVGSISFITESAPPGRRGFFGSLTLFSAIGGVMVGSLAAAVAHAVLSPEHLAAWGWRIPFLAGFLIGVFGLWMRKGLRETPEFEKTKSEGKVSRSPVLEVVRTMPGKILQVAGLVMAMGGGFYILFVWWPTYLTHMVKPPVPHALAVNTVCMVVFMALIPLAGFFSDKWGRKKVLLVYAAGLTLAAYPLFTLVDHGTLLGALAAQLCFAVLVSGVQGPIPATIVEIFPTRTRFSGIALGYNITLGLVGGTAPLICTWLVQATGDIAAPAYYLMILALVTVGASLTLSKSSTAPE